MKIKIVLSFLFLAIIITGCIKNQNPVTPDNYFDPKIVGDWYREYKVNAEGRPDFSIKGFQISEDKFISQLGVDIQTGTLRKSLDNRSPSRIIGSSNGEILIEVPRHGMALGYTYSQKYKVTNSTLIFFSNNGDGVTTTYKKTKIGKKITKPVISEFFTIMDSDTFTNVSIWNCPSAYSGNINISDSLVFEISSRSVHNAAIRIQLNNFSGTGTYILGTGNDGMGYYEQYGGCMVGISFTDQPNSGSISINEYDLVNNVCIGIFEFYVSDKYIEFENGSFRVPIYN